MKTNRITVLYCLPALIIIGAPKALASEDHLVAGPGDQIRLQAPEGGARLEAALDGGPLAPVEGPLTAPGAGDHWLAVASRDLSGNLSPIRWIRLRVDAEPPRVELRTEPAPVDEDRLWMPPVAAVTASAEDRLAGTARLFLTAGEEVREVSDSTVGTVLPSEEGEIAVRAWPWTGCDDASGTSEIRYRWDGGSWRAWRDRDLTPPDGASEHVLAVGAADRRGRTAEPWSVPVRRDEEPPEAPLAERSES